MLAQIENAIVTRLKDAGFNVFHFDEKPVLREEDIQTAAASVYSESGDFNKVTQAVYNCKVKIVILVAWQQAIAATIQRRGLYPVVLGIVQSLMLQDLGLSMKPLNPIRFDRVTDARVEATDVVAYDIEFETSFTMSRVDDEETVDLLEVGLNYYLQDPNDDDVSDAQDTISMGEL